MTKQNKIILEKKCNESFCVPGCTLCSLPKISTRLFLECCDGMNLVPFLLCWILGWVLWDFTGEVQTQLGLGSWGQDCYRRCTIKLNVLKQESKCPAGGLGSAQRLPQSPKSLFFPFHGPCAMISTSRAEISGSSGKGKTSGAFWIRKKQEAAGWEILSRAKQAGVVLTLWHWVLHTGCCKFILYF